MSGKSRTQISLSHTQFTYLPASGQWEDIWESRRNPCAHWETTQSSTQTVIKAQYWTRDHGAVRWQMLPITPMCHTSVILTKHVQYVMFASMFHFWLVFHYKMISLEKSRCNIVRINEDKVEMFSHHAQHNVWWKPNTAYHHKHLIPAVRHGGRGVMIWACFLATGPGKYAALRQMMNFIPQYSWNKCEAV